MSWGNATARWAVATTSAAMINATSPPGNGASGGWLITKLTGSGTCYTGSKMPKTEAAFSAAPNN